MHQSIDGPPVPHQTHPFIASPRHWPTWLLLGCGWLIAQLPYRLLLLLGSACGDGGYWLSRKRWRRAEKQLQRCFPDLDARQLRRLVRANARSYGVGVIERLIGWWWPAQRIRRMLHTVQGLEYVQRAQGEGRGVILLAIHTTTMDMGAALLRLVQEIDFTYQRAENPVLDWVQRRGRSRADIAPLDARGRPQRIATSPIESSSVRAMVKRLNANRVVWYAPDRDFGHAKSHVFAPFFGMPAATITATSRYAKMTGARVISLRYWRDARGYGLEFSAPFENFPGTSEIEDCTRINAAIEAAVRQHPEQYRWTHMRFRTRPSQQPIDVTVPLDSTAQAANAAVAPATSHATAA